MQDCSISIANATDFPLVYPGYWFVSLQERFSPYGQPPMGGPPGMPGPLSVGPGGMPYNGAGGPPGPPMMQQGPPMMQQPGGPQPPPMMQQPGGPQPPPMMQQPGGPQPGPPPQLRAPGGVNPPMRLPSAMRQEYETYMQKRLRMMSQPRQTLVPGVSVISC